MNPSAPPAEPGHPLMVPIPPGRIALRDEGTGRSWYATVDAFWLASVPVTRALYCGLMGGDASPADVPMTEVSWNDAVAFCDALSRRHGLAPCYAGLGDPEATDVRCDFAANGYRLPTEAEWEHACRAGSDAVRYGALEDIGWSRADSDDRLHPVGLKQPNAWGLYDTLGNAWEWCWDVFDSRVYGGYRVFRGGGFADLPRGCRASCRRKSHPTFRVDDLGFRLARSSMGDGPRGA